MIEILYMVHGTTLDNIEKKSTGWLPGELSEKGIQQSIEQAKRIENLKIDYVFCSDLKRAKESARLNFYNRDIDIFVDKRLRECNYGDYNGQDSKLVNYETHIDERFPNGENMHDVEKRMREFLNYLLEKFDNPSTTISIAFVAHKAPQLALEVITKGKTWEQAINEDWRKEHKWEPVWKYIIG